MRTDIEIAPFTRADGFELAASLREPDFVELQAVFGAGWRETVGHLAEYGAVCARHDGRLLMVFGCHPARYSPLVGVPWALGTRAVDRYPYSLCRLGREFVDRWLGLYPVLHNWVASDNLSAVRWLRWLGFNIGPETVLHGTVTFVEFWKGRVLA